MFGTVVVATDGSGSADRAVRAALDLADRFDGVVHALYVLDAAEADAPTGRDVRAAVAETCRETGAAGRGRDADHEDGDGDGDGDTGEGTAPDPAVTTAVREGDPAEEILAYAAAVDADLVATGTRGRHGDHAFLLGSVAEAVVRDAPMPVLTVRQLS